VLDGCIIYFCMNVTSSKEWVGCPIRFAMGLFGDKWTLLIIRDLMFLGKKYFGDFIDSEEKISTNILADRLKKLEASGLVTKQKDPENQSKIVYQLTRKGIDLLPIMLSIVDWSEKYDAKTEVPREFIESLRKDRYQFEKEMKLSLVKKLEKP
jgi:DNA-binding HxlR family transcriptional regulator